MAAYPEQGQPPHNASSDIETITEGGIEVIAETLEKDAAKHWCVVDVVVALQCHHQGNKGKL